MDSFENSKKCLDSVIATISNCDNKANSFLTAVGIVFGFSMFSIQELLGKNGAVETLIIVFGILYLLCFISTIVLLVLIVFPRRRNKIEKSRKIDCQYYSEDLYRHLSADDIETFVVEDVKTDAIVDQIKNCTRIAHIKESLLRVATILIILFALFLVCLVVCLFV